MNNYLAALFAGLVIGFVAGKLLDLRSWKLLSVMALDGVATALVYVAVSARVTCC